jgi:hypothetical protein
MSEVPTGITAVALGCAVLLGVANAGLRVVKSNHE